MEIKYMQLVAVSYKILAQFQLLTIKTILLKTNTNVRFRSAVMITLRAITGNVKFEDSEIKCFFSV